VLSGQVWGELVHERGQLVTVSGQSGTGIRGGAPLSIIGQYVEQQRLSRP
jgi:hypothetical protein